MYKYMKSYFHVYIYIHTHTYATLFYFCVYVYICNFINLFKRHLRLKI